MSEGPGSRGCLVAPPGPVGHLPRRGRAELSGGGRGSLGGLPAARELVLLLLGCPTSSQVS